MRPTQITSLQVADSWDTTPGHAPYRIKIVTWSAGVQGPFRLQYALNDFTPERVNADLAAEVQKLIAIGALPPAQA